MSSILDLFDMPDTGGDKKEFEKLPEGAYQVEIEEAKLDEANQYGPRVAYTLKVTEEGKYRNRKLWVNRKLDPKTVWKIKSDFEALGCGEVKSANFHSALESIIGKVAVIDLAYAPNKTNPDKPYQNVTFQEQTESIPF